MTVALKDGCLIDLFVMMRFIICHLPYLFLSRSKVIWMSNWLPCFPVVSPPGSASTHALYKGPRWPKEDPVERPIPGDVNSTGKTNRHAIF